MTRLLLALLWPGAAFAAPPQSSWPSARLLPAFRAELVKAASQIDGLEKNKRWLDALPMRLEDLAPTTAAYFDEREAREGVGAMALNEDLLRRSLQGLEAMGVEPGQALEAAAWFTLPTVLHEAQHADQFAELKRRGALILHFVEMEVDASAIGVVTYLQLLEKRPDIARLFLTSKGHNNESIELWRQGVKPFSDDILETYRAREPLIPTVPTAERYFQSSIASFRDQLSELDAELKTMTDPGDRAAVGRLRDGVAEALAAASDPQVQRATVGYFRERAEFVDALWSEWSAKDPQRRLASEVLAPRDRARLALEAAEQLSLLSPTYNSDAIGRYLDLAHSEARKARDPGLMAKAGRAKTRLAGRRLDYSIDILRGRAAVETSERMAQFVEVQKRHLEPRMGPGDFRVFQEEARSSLELMAPGITSR